MCLLKVLAKSYKVTDQMYNSNMLLLVYVIYSQRRLVFTVAKEK